jgi:pimeloyl-ACP methyl ester carboxylesterase
VIPETRYAKTSEGVHIAYQVLGEGPVDFVYVGPWVTHLEYRWDLPRYAAYLRRIASSSRLILFDKRGFGMSDPVDPKVAAAKHRSRLYVSPCVVWCRPVPSGVVPS